jgi:hypothetical protein
MAVKNCANQTTPVIAWQLFSQQPSNTKFHHHSFGVLMLLETYKQDDYNRRFETLQMHLISAPARNRAQDVKPATSHHSGNGAMH